MSCTVPLFETTWLNACWARLYCSISGLAINAGRYAVASQTKTSLNSWYCRRFWVSDVRLQTLQSPLTTVTTDQSQSHNDDGIDQWSPTTLVGRSKGHLLVELVICWRHNTDKLHALAIFGEILIRMCGCIDDQWANRLDGSTALSGQDAVVSLLRPSVSNTSSLTLLQHALTMRSIARGTDGASTIISTLRFNSSLNHAYI